MEAWPSTSSIDSDINASNALVVNALRLKHSKLAPFVKKLDDVLKIMMHANQSHEMALRLAKIGLITYFMGLWASLHSLNLWVDKNWRPMIEGKLSVSFYGRVFFSFFFEKNENRDLIFQSGSYFIFYVGSRFVYKLTEFIFQPRKWCFNNCSCLG